MLAGDLLLPEFANVLKESDLSLAEELTKARDPSATLKVERDKDRGSPATIKLQVELEDQEKIVSRSRDKFKILRVNSVLARNALMYLTKMSFEQNNIDSFGYRFAYES